MLDLRLDLTHMGSLHLILVCCELQRKKMFMLCERSAHQDLQLLSAGQAGPPASDEAFTLLRLEVLSLGTIGWGVFCARDTTLNPGAWGREQQSSFICDG